MNGMALTAEQLGRLRCDCGAQEPLVHLKARCHPAAGLRAKYVKPQATIVLTCAKCTKMVAMVAVASETATRRAP